jgi:hypothetical protein
MGQKGFNLLQPQEAPPTFWDKAYSWVVGTARVIIIIIEIVVFGAFAFRFILDSQTKALDDQIKVQQFKLDALKDKEADFRKLQVKGVEYQKQWDKSSKYYATLTEVDSYLPQVTNDLIIQISQDVLTIRGFANLSSVASLETALKNSPSFESTEVFEVHEQGSTTEQRGIFAVRTHIKDSSTRSLITDNSTDTNTDGN